MLGIRVTARWMLPVDGWAPVSAPRFDLEALERRVLLSAGDLDASFGTGGVVSTSFFDPTLDVPYQNQGISWLSAATVAQDGKVVVVGTARNNEEICLYRYDADGSLDDGFGDGGIVYTDFVRGWDVPTGLRALRDGKLLVWGIAHEAGQPPRMTIARYNVDGTLDHTFGESGIMMPGHARFAFATDIYVLADGSMLLIGSADGATNQDAMVMKTRADGSLDTDYGDEGLTLIHLDDHDAAYSSILLDGGQLVLLVNSDSDTAGIQRRTQVIRLNADGSIDDSFGGSGGTVALNELGTNLGIGKIVALSDGGFLYGTSRYERIDGQFSFDMLVARFDADGRLDRSFGENGVVVIEEGNRLLDHMIVQPNGRIVLAGTIYQGGTTDNGPRSDLLAMRLETDGSLDQTFGADGVVIVDTADREHVHRVALAHGGDIMLMGQAGLDGPITMARLEGDPIATASTRPSPIAGDDTGDSLFSDARRGLFAGDALFAESAGRRLFELDDAANQNLLDDEDAEPSLLD